MFFSTIHTVTLYLAMFTFNRQVSGPSRDNPDMIVHDLYEPCAPRAAGSIEMNWTQVEGEKLKEPLVSMVSVVITSPCIYYDQCLHFIV